MATVSFLRTQTGMKSRLDLACAYQQLSQDENLDHGKYRIIVSGCELCTCPRCRYSFLVVLL